MSCGTRVSEMPTNRSHHLGAMPGVRGRRNAVAAAALAVLVALMSSVLVGCEAQSRTTVLDDFESGAITGWQAVGSGSGGWFVYADGHKAPDPAQSDPNAPFDVPDPPQGKFAAVTDMNGPGTRILYRDLRLEGRFGLQLSVFYTGSGPFSSPATLAYDAPEANQQFRIDLLRPSAPIDSVAKSDVLVNVFHTSPGDAAFREPTDVNVNVPSNWRQLSEGSSVWFAPDGAYGQVQNQAVFTHGVNIGVANTQFLSNLGVGNGNLRQRSGLQRTTFGGRTGLTTSLSNINEATGQSETVTVITTQNRDGKLVFMLAVAPDNESGSYQTAFRNVLRSIQIAG